VNALPIPCLEFFTHSNSFGDLPLANREIGFRDIMKLVGTVLVQFKTPNSDGSTVNASILIGDFPIRKSAQVMSWFTRPTNHRTPNSDACVLIPRATSPPFSALSGIAGSQFHRSQFLCTIKPECRIPTSRDLMPPVPYRSTAPM
jgi:hypothetical protein